MLKFFVASSLCFVFAIGYLFDVEKVDSVIVYVLPRYSSSIVTITPEMLRKDQYVVQKKVNTQSEISEFLKLIDKRNLVRQSTNSQLDCRVVIDYFEGNEVIGSIAFSSSQYLQYQNEVFSSEIVDAVFDKNNIWSTGDSVFFENMYERN